MTKGRLEAFSDGVIAIIITIMVLELRTPAGHDLESLRPVAITFAFYALSFVFLVIYWSNHHHLFQAVRHVNGAVLWANLALLFFLSLVPYFTAWMGESHMAAWPTALYGVVFLLSAMAYTVLSLVLIAAHPEHSTLKQAIGTDLKGKASLGMYAAAIPLAFVMPAVSCGLYAAVAILWLIPDRRIERMLAKGGGSGPHAAG